MSLNVLSPSDYTNMITGRAGEIRWYIDTEDEDGRLVCQHWKSDFRYSVWIYSTLQQHWFCLWQMAPKREWKNITDFIMSENGGSMLKMLYPYVREEDFNSIGDCYSKLQHANLRRV